MKIREDGDIIQLTGEKEKTRYSSHTFMGANGGVVMVIQDPRENSGPKFYSTSEGKSEATQKELSKVVGMENAKGKLIKAEDIVMHRENKDGSYSVSTFITNGWDDKEKRAKIYEVSHPSKNITKEELGKRLENYIELDKKIEAKNAKDKLDPPKLDKNAKEQVQKQELEKKKNEPSL